MRAIISTTIEEGNVWLTICFNVQESAYMEREALRSIDHIVGTKIKANEVYSQDLTSYHSLLIPIRPKFKL